MDNRRASTYAETLRPCAVDGVINYFRPATNEIPMYAIYYTLNLPIPYSVNKMERIL